MNTLNLIKNINNSKLLPIYYITGSNQWLKKECLDQIINKTKLEKNCVEVYKFEGKNVNISDFINICESIPLGCDFKCIVVKDWEVDKVGENQLKVLVNLFSDIPEFCNIIIANINITVINSKIKKLVDVIKKSGTVLDASLPSQADIIDFIKLNTQQNNCTISSSNAKKLAIYCNNDMDKISNEIEKLTSFCCKREITLQDIDLLTIPSIEIKIFDMLNFINNNNKSKALEILKKLLYNKEEPIVIMSIISMNFLDIYRAKVAIQNKKRPIDIINIFEYKGKDFRINKAFIESSKYSYLQIKSIINILIEYDYKIKTSTINKEIILEELLYQLFIIKNS